MKLHISGMEVDIDKPRAIESSRRELGMDWKQLCEERAKGLHDSKHESKRYW